MKYVQKEKCGGGAEEDGAGSRRLRLKERARRRKVGRECQCVNACVRVRVCRSDVWRWLEENIEDNGETGRRHEQEELQRRGQVTESRRRDFHSQSRGRGVCTTREECEHTHIRTHTLQTNL